MGYEVGTAYLSIIPTMQGMSGELDKMFGPVTKKAEESGKDSGGSFLGSFKGAALGGIAAIGLAVGAAFADAYAEAVDVRKAGVKLQASLGMSPDDAAAAGKIAGNLYRQNYGESISGLTEDVGTVKSALKDLGGSDLEVATRKALSFSEAFGVDVADSVQSVNTLIGSGLAKDANQAFDLLTKSSQKVPEALRGDIKDAADEYGRYFNQIGLSGEQAFSLLVIGADKGALGIDKTGDAIGEFSKLVGGGDSGAMEALAGLGLNAAEMSTAMVSGGDAARNATAQIVTSLKSIGDPGQQAATAISLFGTPLEDLGTDQVPKFLDAMSGSTNAMEGFAGSADAMDAALGSTASGLDTLWRNVKASLVDFINEKVLPAITAVTQWLAEKLTPVVQQVTAWLGEHLAPTIQKVADFFTQVLVPAAMKAWEWFEQNLLPTIQRIGQFIADTFGNAIAILGGVIDFIVGVFTGDWSRAWDGIKAIFGGIWDQIQNIIGLAWDVVTGIGTKILDWLGQLGPWAWERISAFGGQLVEWGGQFLQWIWDGITTKAEELWAWFTSLPGRVWESIKATAGQAGETVLGWGSEFIGWIGSGIADGASEIWNWFIALPTKAWTILTALKDGVIKIGKDFANWIVDGIKGAAQAVADAVSSLFNLKLNEDGTGYIALGAETAGGIVPGGARGAVVPGRDPGRRDNVLGRLPDGSAFGLRSEEAIMVPEFTHAAGGPSGIYRLNRLAEAGRLGEIMGGAAWGGVVPKAKEIGRMVSEGIAGSIKADDVSALWDHIGDDARQAAGKSLGGSVDPSSARGRFIAAMLSKQGTSYVWGAAGPNVFDCSGLVSWALAQAGVGRGRLTAEGFNSSLPRAGEMPGNLVTFDTGRLPGRAGHIGAIVDVARGLMMHTDGAGPARISDYRSRDGGPLSIVDAIGGGAAGAVSSALTGILSRVKGVITGAFNNAVGPSGEIPAGSGVERWRSTVLSALGITGQPASYADIVLNQMRTESSGNERAINLTDSNARRGTPSKGLMQVIDPTFRAYALAPYNRDVYDPLSNIIASIRYVLSRYGSIPAGMRGMAYDVGGWLTPGTMGVNMLNKPEAVLTPAQSDALVTHAKAIEAGYSGAQVPTVHVYIGDRELTDLVDVRVDYSLDQAASMVPMVTARS